LKPCVISTVSCHAWFVGLRLPVDPSLLPSIVKFEWSSNIVTPRGTVSDP